MKKIKLTFEIGVGEHVSTPATMDAPRNISAEELTDALRSTQMAVRDELTKAAQRAQAKREREKLAAFVKEQVDKRSPVPVGENEQSLIADVLAAYATTMRHAPLHGLAAHAPSITTNMLVGGDHEFRPHLEDETLDEIPGAPIRRKSILHDEGSPHSSKPFSAMTLEELREEEQHWKGIIDGEKSWGAGVAAANSFLKECQQWIARREHEAKKAERDAQAEEAGSTMKQAMKDALEDAARVTREQVEELTGLAKTAVTNHMVRNGFPRPGSDGLFSKADVIKWMDGYVKTAKHALAQPTVEKLVSRLEDMFDKAVGFDSEDDQMVGGVTAEETPEETSEEPKTEKAAEPFRVYSLDVPDFVGIPDPTAIYSYKQRYGFPENAGRDGRKVYWMSDDLIAWMEKFTSDARPMYFPTERFDAIKAALAKAKATTGETHTPAKAPKEIVEDLSWSAQAFVLYIGEEGVVAERNVRDVVREELTREGLIETNDEGLVLTDLGAKVYDLTNDGVDA